MSYRTMVCALTVALGAAAFAGGCSPVSDRAEANIIPQQHEREVAYALAKWGSFYSDEMRRDLRSVVRSENLRACADRTGNVVKCWSKKRKHR